MVSFVWSEMFQTGLDELDAQHRELVELIGRVGDLAEGVCAREPQRLQSVLEHLVRRTAEHFTSEERLMEEAGCDPRHLDWHRGEHSAFLRQIGLMGRGALADGDCALTALSDFLCGWFAFHVLGADHSAVRQIHAIRSEVPAALAYEQEAADADAGAGTLLAALEQMVKVIVSRNLVLAETQEMLQRANLRLEAKVEARTHELERSNAELSATVKRLEEAQHQLLQTEKMASIGQLAAGVAHEINNPVGFVNSNLGTLTGYVGGLLELLTLYEAEEPGMSPAARARLAQSKQQVDLDYLRQDILDLLGESQDGLGRVTRIVQDLKEFSRVDHGEWQLADLNKGLESTLNVVWNELKYKAEVVKAYGELPPVMCLPAQLNQVFLNLLVNAAQAIEDKGVIKIGSGVEGDWVWVEIADTGKGMTPEVQRRIFEPFFTTKPVGQGTGLGLSLAYGIVDKHHGRVEVNSEVGRGTRFTVWLPREQAATDASGEQAAGTSR